MKCPRCQHENETGAKFCEECAAPLARTCGNCGRQLSPTAKFCPDCAHPTGLAATAPTTPRFPSPESYTPKHLAERILDSKAASVIGKDVPFVLLHAVAEAGEDAVHRGLAHLQAAEFLYETRLFPDPEYTFKHALTHEVTYGTLLQDRRKTLHARIVGAIERFYPDRLAEHVERVAHHAVRGEMWEQAVTYLRQAGVKALAQSANREAVSCFEQALTALGHLPETRERAEQAIDLLFDLRTSLFPLGEFERIVGYLREAEVLARTLDDQRRVGQMSVYMCHNLWITGHPTEALGFGQNALALAESLGDAPLQITGNLYLGAACHGTGDYRQAEELLRKVSCSKLI